MERILRFLKLATLAAIFSVLASCGGGGGGSGGGTSTTTPPTTGVTLSGTAATGAPIVGGAVTLKDSVGATAPATTDAKGNYSFDVSATHFPVMLKVQPNIPGAVPLFSAALTSGTANITPLTTLQVFEAVGKTDPSTIFNSGDFSKIGKSSLDQGKSTVASNLTAQYAANGLDLITLDPITTPMVANGVGEDALFDHTNVAIIGNGASITDSTGKCLDYGPHNAVTLAVDGMDPGNFAAFFSAPPLASSSVMDAQYVKNALAKVCVPGIDKLRPFETTNPNDIKPNDIMQSNVIWTRNTGLYDTYDSPSSAVKQLENQLRDANARNILAKQHGGRAGPINIVAHSWGTIIAYIALKELAGSVESVEQVPGDKLITVANLITMGSPIQYLSDSSPSAILRIGPLSLFLGNVRGSVPPAGSVASVPAGFRAQPIVKPNNVTTWTNYWNNGDIISSEIDSKSVMNEPVADCPAPLLTGTAVTPCSSHSVYFDLGNGQPVAPTLYRILSLIAASSAEQLPAPTTAVSPPALTTPTPPPSAFSLTAGTPYCDTATPVGPAVKLTWNASDGAVFYRVFKNDSAIGVNLVASQLSFQNNLGLVAGQAYSYKVQAMNADGTTWSNTVPVTIPADVCGSSTSLNFTTPSLGMVSATTVGYKPTLTASGNITQVSFSWSGATSGSTTWVKNDANWLSKVTTNPDGSITLKPVVTQTGDPSGTTNWTVTLKDSTGATKTQSFTVNYTPTVAPTTPAIPASLSPGSTNSPGLTLGSSAVTVSWIASSGATSYIGGITDIAAGSSVLTISTNGTSATATLSPGKQYRWFVYACNSSGCSNSSALYYFQTPTTLPRTLPAGYISQGGLTWMPVTFYNTWANANAYCAGTINGQTGWRVPTQPELSALYTSGAMNGQSWTLLITWSSTANGSGYHYNVGLDSGSVVSYDNTYNSYVSCVR